jgi:DNA-binding transcriptional ArsR family regulator
MKSCEISPDEKLGKDQMERIKDIISKIPEDNILYGDAEHIKALADPTRLKIIYLLKYGELCVCEIIAALDKPQPTVSHHLNILKKAGFLKWRKEGVWIHYSLSDPHKIKIIDEIIKERK